MSLRSARQALSAFTLIELLVVIAIIGLLVGLLIPSLRSIRRSGALAKELSAERQLMVAYRSYAYDHRGALLPGYYFTDDIDGVDEPLDATDEWGTLFDQRLGPEGSLTAARYPWRIAPYLDYNFSSLYLDPHLQARFTSYPDDAAYPDAVAKLSKYPAFGINAIFLGGHSYFDAFDLTSGIERYYATRISEVKHPARLIVFASSRVNGDLSPFDGSMIEGFHEVRAPNPASWSQQYQVECESSGCDTADFGFVSLRHPGLKAAIGFFDGHTGTLTYGFDPNDPDGDPGIVDNIRDMRYWADQADGFDWDPERP